MKLFAVGVSYKKAPLCRSTKNARGRSVQPEMKLGQSDITSRPGLYKHYILPDCMSRDSDVDKVY
jgi:hypothetical protein